MNSTSSNYTLTMVNENDEKNIPYLGGYVYEYDYVVGDFAYGKLRLKGFYEDKNPKANKINKYSNLDKYIKDNCAYGCKYFVAKKKNS